MATPTARATGSVVLEDDALARKKLLATSSFSALSQPPQPNQPIPNAHAAFRGLYVVQSATEPRHVKYAMEIASPELQLHVRITQRYSAFYVLRKRLLQSLKKCQDAAARPTLLRTSSTLFDLDLQHTLLLPCCAGCAGVRKALKRTPFPRRAFVFTTVDDVDARAPLLETFLSECVRLIGAWPGCARGRKFACVVLGQFLSMNLLLHVFQQLRLTMAETEPATSVEDDANEPAVVAAKEGTEKAETEAPTPSNQADREAESVAAL